jgi:hypothetical protein
MVPMIMIPIGLLYNVPMLICRLMTRFHLPRTSTIFQTDRHYRTDPDALGRLRSR